MIRALIDFSIRFRGVVIAFACVLTAYGIYVVRNAKYDVYPEFAPVPEVVVADGSAGPLSRAGGSSRHPAHRKYAERCRQCIESLRSESTQGLSVITAIFQEQTDVYRARQVVGERLTEVSGALPQSVREPVMAPLTSAASMVLAIGLTSDTRSLMDLRTFADWTLRAASAGRARRG